MNQPFAATQNLRISFGDARQRWLAATVAEGGWTAGKALWVCLVVVGLSLFSAYVLVLRDAVHNGEAVRAALAQQLVHPARTARVAPAGDALWLAAAPTAR